MISRPKVADHRHEGVDESIVLRRRHPYFGDHATLVINKNTEALGATNINADATDHDSTRVFNSLSVLRMRFSARRLTKPGSGSTSSISKA